MRDVATPEWRDIKQQFDTQVAAKQQRRTDDS